VLNTINIKQLNTSKRTRKNDHYVSFSANVMMIENLFDISRDLNFKQVNGTFVHKHNLFPWEPVYFAHNFKFDYCMQGRIMTSWDPWSWDSAIKGSPQMGLCLRLQSILAYMNKGNSALAVQLYYLYYATSIGCFLNSFKGICLLIMDNLLVAITLRPTIKTRGSSGYVYIIIMKKQSLQDVKIKGVCICQAQHDKIVACLQEKVEQVYIKSMCRHSILLDTLDTVICWTYWEFALLF
jgi:hypothetical protein